ncbi:MAG: hypothetical protein LW878_03975 [Proteobacteria bacterium]|jgi:hypothetical protein|nr:hypothetical protein [Pseudomonadota bacterium]
MGRILFFIVNLLMSSPSVAGSLKAAQWLPWSFISQTWSNQNFNFEHFENQIDLNWQDLKPQLKNVQLQLNGQLGDSQFNRIGLQTQSLDMNASMSIGELTVDQIVKIELNGNNISVRVEARCSGMRITIPRFKTQASGIFIKEKNYWRPELDALDLFIPQAGWEISNLSCTGLGGVGELITKRITQALQDPQTITPFLREWLAPQIQMIWNALWQKLLDSSSNQVTILSMENPSDKGVLLLAELPLQTNRVVQLPLIREGELSHHLPQLVFSQASLEAIMEDRLLAMIPKNYDLREFEEFRTLQNSRLLQSFVWPDLRRFSKNTPFYVVPKPSDSALSLQPSQNSQWQASMRVQGAVQTFIGFSPINYLDWGLSLQTKLSLQVDQSILTIKTAQPTTRMAIHFSGLYFLVYKPNQKLSSSIVQDAVQGFFKPTTVQEELPVLRWNERIWKLQNLERRADLITMDWIE